MNNSEHSKRCEQEGLQWLEAFLWGVLLASTWLGAVVLHSVVSRGV